MKLCAMVLEFHQTPNAITGAAGIAIRRAPCTAANATIIASHSPMRRAPPRAPAKLIVAIAGPSVFEIQQRADRRVVRPAAHAVHSRVEHVLIGVLRGIVLSV